MIDKADHIQPLRSYGRRKGHSLSPRQAALYENLLPQISLNLNQPAPRPLGQLFPDLSSQETGSEKVWPEKIWLEIGFGAGEHLLWQAEHNPDIGFIGCEPYINGVAKALVGIEQNALKNIRLYDDDMRAVLSWLPPASLDRVFILFPDPWPKKRHNKRRLVNTATLDQLAPVMRPGATLRLASDIGDYLRTSLIALMAHPDFTWRDQRASDWRTRPDDWPQTRYEQKAMREGRIPSFLTFERR